MDRVSSNIAWVLEREVLSPLHDALASAARGAGHVVVDWNDEWWLSEEWPRLAGSRAVFHGSLDNAARIRAELPWRPGSYCNEPAFRCSAWYEQARSWLLHRDWRILPAVELVARADEILSALGMREAVFVRPDSPLKPFAGRVLARDNITLRALDHGLYFDDEQTPVVVAPVQEVGREWRYVIARGQVIAGSAYNAATRTAMADDPSGEPWGFAEQIARELPPPDDIYVLDVCACRGELRLLELNPFSGADLYACDLAAIVRAVGEINT